MPTAMDDLGRGFGFGLIFSQKPAQCLQISNIVKKKKMLNMLSGKGILGTDP